METCGQNSNLRECHGTPRYLTTVYSLALLKLLDTIRRSFHMPKHQKLAKIVTTIFKRSLDGSRGRRGKIACHRRVSCLAAADADASTPVLQLPAVCTFLPACAQQVPLLRTG